MFDCWADIFSPSMRRVVEPPEPVLVELSLAIPHSPGGRFGRDTLPMRVKAGGLDLTRTVPGRLLAWARCSDGSWLGLVEFVIATGNDRGRVAATQWCAARALTPDPGRRIR
ncbi:hypothetical protein [Nocardia sp. alder85J]|uniref:hypothetical protein n=1 Tax=Nocardia sp. alder85J TaxID=2862949 RepID=UPI001CD6F251|nr:hypothetical protein [Nocardia sp. alder85J]MCX4095882.1 hypothetical protein [Nocardia sp. alder85J]